jgi:hypothetical protein
MSERELERLHSGLVRLASMDETVLAVLVEHVLAGDEAGSSSVVLAREQEGGGGERAPMRLLRASGARRRALREAEHDEAHMQD